MAFGKTTAYYKIKALKKRIRVIQGGSCFVGNTPVLLSNGRYKMIKDIQPGDMVLSRVDTCGIIKTEVTRAWSNPATKPIIEITINGERLRSTYDHKFYTTQGYKELYKIIWRKMETSQRLQLELLCEQYGADIDVNTLRSQEQPSNNEASGLNRQAQTERQKSLPKDSNGRQNSESTSSSSSNVATKPRQLTTDKSQERSKERQPISEPGVVYKLRESSSCLQEWSEQAKTGAGQQQDEAYSRDSADNTERVGQQYQPSNTQRICGKVRGERERNQECIRERELEMATVDEVRIQEPEEVFAIEVAETGNYFVSNQNINVSNSAGKTIAILLLLLEYATANKGKLITVAAVNYPHLRRGAMRDFINILNDNNYWNYYKIEHNRSDSTFTFFNGSTVEFVALNEFTARGARRDVLFVNEANLINYETYEQLEIRTKDFVIIDYNPTSEFWAHTELVSKQDVDFIITTYKDNEALDEEIVKAIERRKPNTNWWRVYGKGEIGELEGLVYSGWEMIDDIPEEAELTGYGLDFGYTNDPTAIVAVYKYDGGYILDELCYKTGLFNDNIAEIIKEHGLESTMGVADSSAPKDIDEIARHGITIKGAQKKSGEPAKSYNQWAISKIQELKISYTANSHNLRKEYLGYMWATDRTGKSLNIPEDGNDHILDAAKYKLIDLLYAPKIQFYDSLDRGAESGRGAFSR